MSASATLRDRFPLKINVGEAVFRSNIASAVKRDLPWLQRVKAHDGRAVVVAGGPSLNDCIEHVRALKKSGWTVFCINNTMRVLLENGIAPDYQVLLDAKPTDAKFVVRYPGTKYLLASQCAPETFDAAGETMLWHPNVEGIEEFVTRPTIVVGSGGTTCGILTLGIVYQLGFRRLDLVGYDSSYRDGEGHAYKQPENDGENMITAVIGGRKFECAVWMVHQVEEFKVVLKKLVDLDCAVSVAGDGYLQETVRQMIHTGPLEGENLTVTFQWQSDDRPYGTISTAPLAKIMLESVRTHMPKARIVQMTNDTFPECSGVDEVIRNGDTKDLFIFGFSNLVTALDRFGTDVLSIATDVRLQQDVSDVFRRDFDIASCKYPVSTRDDGTYCGDVMFVKQSGKQFLRDVIEYYKSKPELHDGWDGGQIAFRDVARMGKYKVLDLDFDTYCKTPETRDEDVSQAFIVHYRGIRKTWMVA